MDAPTTAAPSAPGSAAAGDPYAALGDEVGPEWAKAPEVPPASPAGPGAAETDAFATAFDDAAGVPPIPRDPDAAYVAGYKAGKRETEADLMQWSAEAVLEAAYPLGDALHPRSVKRQACRRVMREGWSCRAAAIEVKASPGAVARWVEEVRARVAAENAWVKAQMLAACVRAAEEGESR